jgi:hypothetical protein
MLALILAAYFFEPIQSKLSSEFAGMIQRARILSRMATA